MGVKATASGGGGGNFERLESGAYPARCVHVIGMGTHPNNHPQAKAGSKKVEVMIVWEVSELMEDGRPFTVNKRYTLSLGTKANLYKDLVAWRAKAFTDDELQGFDLSNILDAKCLLSISKTEKGDKTYNKVEGVMPLPKGMEVIERQNPLIDFAVEELGSNEETMKQIWPWVKKIIWESEEGKVFHAANPNYAPDQPKEGEDATSAGA